jgi:hypothetical protein
MSGVSGMVASRVIGTILSASPKTLVLEPLSTCAYMSVQYDNGSTSKKRFDLVFGIV